MKRELRKNLKVGDWIDTGSSIDEIVEPYDEYHQWYLTREVIFGDDDNYTLSNKVSRVTYDDLSHCELM